MIAIFQQIPLHPPGEPLKGYGRLGLQGVDASEGSLVLTEIISNTIGIMTVIAFIWFVIQLFIGALSILTAGSDKNKVSEALVKIRNAFIGLVMVIMAIVIANIVGYFFGVDFLNLQFLINNL